jgi:hypothetical protein
MRTLARTHARRARREGLVRRPRGVGAREPADGRGERAARVDLDQLGAARARQRIIYRYIHTYIYMHVYTYIRTYMYTYIYTHTYIHIHIYTYRYTHTDIHTHTHTHVGAADGRRGALCCNPLSGVAPRRAGALQRDAAHHVAPRRRRVADAQVISALSSMSHGVGARPKGHHAATHVPYRDSKLTRILQVRTSRPIPLRPFPLAADPT